MENEQLYRVVAWWSSGKSGLVKSDSAPNAIHFTAPLQFGGFEGRWSPEDLLLAAVAGCYTTTFRALAEYSKFEYSDLEVEARGVVRKAESGYKFDGIVILDHSPTMVGGPYAQMAVGIAYMKALLNRANAEAKS